MKMAPSALADIRVVDCTHVIAGAYCSMLLADLGAEVIKVEPIGGEGDRINSNRNFSPFELANRNKRAIAVDIRRPEGADIIRRLARKADVFVENFRPGVFDKLGLGYEHLRTENHGLIYCSISGFGHTGPYRDRGGFDLVAQAMSGIASFTGEIGSTRPVAAGVPLSDLSAGCFGALGILAALNYRRTSGVGQKVESTLLESALGYALWETGLYLATGEVAKPRGSRHRLAAPYEALKTADGFMAVGVTNQRLWAKFCKALGTEGLETAPEFATPADRIANRDLLQMRLEALLETQSTAHWTEQLLAQGVPCGPVNTIAEAVNDPQIAARGLLVEVEGRRFTRAPITLSETPVTVKTAAADVGRDTREVLRACDYSVSEIDALAASYIIGLDTSQPDESAA
jgi:formyl-CoA transferase